MTQYIGTSPQAVFDGFIKRYFYGIRRNDDGELFLIKIDQFQGGTDQIAIINDIGDLEDNFEDFEEGIDYLSGVDETHDVVNKNLKYPQYRWDGRSLIYYIDPIDGQFIQKINQLHEYETNISSEGY
jgi:hypothetical protein|tara:strand:- start:65992 stop:66372 length:381 start_codon:yes stop_codon:yes gene_type:complete